MLVNQSMKASLDKSLQLLLLSAVSVGLLGISPATAQAPAVGATPVTPAAPANTSAPAMPLAPVSAPTTPAQVAPATSATPATPATSTNTATLATPSKNPHSTTIKPGTEVYNGTNASTLDFANRNPGLKKPAGPADPWKMAAFAETNPAYTLDVKYPQFDPVKGSDPSKLNDEVKRYVAAQIDAIRVSMPTQMKHIEGPKPLSYIKGVCEVSFYNEHLCSMSVDLTSYAFQSAHPIEAITTFNYRLDSNQQFPIKDVFRSDFKYVPAISKICIATLSQGLDDEGVEWVRRGAAAEDKNFQKFQITSHELKIVFDPYTVDNGADGFKVVPIVWDRLRSNISLDAPFHKLVSR
jgi:hypothetical protein